MNPSRSPRPLSRSDIVILVTFSVLFLVFALGFQSAMVSYSQNPRKDAVNQRSIVMSMINYAKDHDGRFPTANDAGVPFTNSTEAFQYLIEHSDGLKEEYFYVPGNPQKRRGADNDRVLTVQENCLIYVTEQNDAMSMDSPLTADEMETPGVYGKNHPWLKNGRAAVGYAGGHANVEKLNQKLPGATIQGPPGSGITDIFEPRPAGLLSVPRENILLP